MYNIEYFDMVRIIKAFDFGEFDARLIASYLDELDYDINFTVYIWNTALFNSVCLKGDNSVAVQYIKDNLCCDVEDCIIYEDTSLGGVYVEWS